jgi:hypothetical protein
MWSHSSESRLTCLWCPISPSSLYVWSIWGRGFSIFIWRITNLHVTWSWRFSEHCSCPSWSRLHFVSVIPSRNSCRRLWPIYGETIFTSWRGFPFLWLLCHILLLPFRSLLLHLLYFLIYLPLCLHFLLLTLIHCFCLLYSILNLRSRILQVLLNHDFRISTTIFSSLIIEHILSLWTQLSRLLLVLKLFFNFV